MNISTYLSKCPSPVESIYLSNSGLTSLEGSPNVVAGNYEVASNGLASLRGAPTTVGGIFDCSHNKHLKSLAGAPRYSKGINATYCNINSISEGFSGSKLVIDGDLDLSGNPLTSLHDIHDIVESVSGYLIIGHNIQDSILGVMEINGVKEIVLVGPCAGESLGLEKAICLINKYLANDALREEWQDCSHEMKMAGLFAFAKR